MVILIFIIIAITVSAVIISSKKEESKQLHQPIHFDMLEPLPKEPIVNNLQYFCIKDKGYHVSVWPKDQGMRNLDFIEFDIAGISHRYNIDKYLGEHVGTLEAEPTNPYDANAIKILAEDGHHVGYVPKDITAEVRKHSKLPCRCYFYIGENDRTYYSDCYIKIQL